MKAAKREEEKRGRRRGHIIQRTRHTRHKEIKNSSRKVEKKQSAEEERGKKRREGGVKRWAVLGKYKKRQTHAECSGARSHLTGLSCSPPTSLSPSLFHSAVCCAPLCSALLYPGHSHGLVLTLMLREIQHRGAIALIAIR